MAACLAHPPLRQFRFVEAFLVAGGERCHHRVLGQVRLEQHAARPLSPPSAPGDLIEQLKRALRGAQVTATQTEIGIDHTDQSEIGKVMPLGNDLGPDQKIELVIVHRAHQFGRFARPGRLVAGHDRDPSLGQQRLDLLGDPLDAGATGDQRVDRAAFGAMIRLGAAVAAVVAEQAPPQAMENQPGAAIGTAQAMAAGTAQGQRREATSVEKQQGLLAGFEGRREARPKAWC